jgi:hypothetical protein
VVAVAATAIMAVHIAVIAAVGILPGHIVVHFYFSFFSADADDINS